MYLTSDNEDSADKYSTIKPGTHTDPEEVLAEIIDAVTEDYGEYEEVEVP